MLCLRNILAGAMVLATAITAGAEPPRVRADGGSKAPAAQNRRSLGNRMSATFDNRGPKVGDPLPDITIFDAQGQPFRLRSLKGHYSVIVFGCLT